MTTVGSAAVTNPAASLRRADGTPVRVLVVDDEPSLAELLMLALRYEGWQIRTAANGTDALRAAQEFRPDAVVLDVMLPDMDGLTVLRRLRAEVGDVPTLFLTAKDAVADRIAGLTAGGDDYVTKPFSLEEVVARLRSLVRRTLAVGASEENLLIVGDLVMDEESHEVRRAGDLVNLTATEFELLRYLMRNPRRVLSKAQILDRVWKYDFGGQANVVEIYICYLRKKIDARCVAPGTCSSPPADRQLVAFLTIDSAICWARANTSSSGRPSPSAAIDAVCRQISAMRTCTRSSGA
jgi:two-component system OmpR family response regulator